MQDLPTIIVVFAAIVMIVDHLRRLLTAISLNRSIRDAFRHHPDSVPLLIDRMETRHPFPLTLGGWVFLGFGILAGALSTIGYGEIGREGLLPGVVIAAVGASLLVASWWVNRSPRPAI